MVRPSILALAMAMALALALAGCQWPALWGSESTPAEKPDKIDPYEVLLDALRSGQPLLESLAAETFFDADRPPPREDIDPLADAPDPRVRTIVVALLGTMRRSDLAPVFRRKQQDSDPSVRLAAAFALAMTGDAAQVTALRDALASRDLTLRRNAAWLLGLMGEPSAAGMLKLKLDDVDAMVVLLSAEALHRLGSSDGLDVVRDLTEHERHPIRAYATRLLGRMGVTADIPRLERLCQSRYLDAKFAAIGALAQQGDLKRIDMLLDMLDAPEADTRELAARELGGTAYTPAVARLATLLTRPDPLERTAAAAAIVRIRSARRPWRARILVDQPLPATPATPAAPVPGMP